MSRIFISHSSANNAEAIAIKAWMADHGWDDVFLDLDPERGLKAGERWQEALKRAAERCELVVFLVSPDWAASKWCLAEFLLAKSLNKRIFAVIVAPMRLVDVPTEMSTEWQLVDLTAGIRDIKRAVLLPPDPKTPGVVRKAEVSLASDGLNRLRIGLVQAGLDAKFFAWPPASDPSRPLYRGLKPLETEDAGIFFGRDGQIVEALDRLRGLREGAPPRLLVVIGASGAGKSSFLRAGLLPRLARDDRHFLPLPIVRPERAAISGETGLIAALTEAMARNGQAVRRATVRENVSAGIATVRPMLAALAHSATARLLTASPGAAPTKPPSLILPIDQGEELFLAEGTAEAQAFLALLRDLLTEDAPALIALVAIRSDNYERLQMAKPLEGLRQSTLSLPPMPQGNYAEVIRGPARRLEGTARKLAIEDRLTERLLADIEAGGAKDALPLLAFTLERLYAEYGGDGDLKLAEYETLGGLAGSIGAAVERAFKAADGDARIPKDREARLTLLRRGLIPWLAGIDPDTKAPRRRVARLSEIPAEARPLIDLLIEQRLLSTDLAKDTGETTIEPAHEALLRQWGVLQGWLSEDMGLLGALDGVKRSARDWASNARSSAWLVHGEERLRLAHSLLARSDLVASLEPTDREYLDCCVRKEATERRRKIRTRAAIGSLSLGLLGIGGMAYAGWLDRSYLAIQALRLADIYFPATLSRDAELAMKPGARFKECASCPEMIVLPPGEFMMGSPEGEGRDDERPRRKIDISRPFAVSAFEITFDQWDACVAHGGCTYQGKDASWGRGVQPVTKVSWNDANLYVRWLSKQTGRGYRLLTEAEWEYAARGGTVSRYSFGDDPALLDEYAWYDYNSRLRTSPVGLKKANPFGLHDMHGNAWEWVEDCYADTHENRPSDSSAVSAIDCTLRVLRGGSWASEADNLRSAARYGYNAIFRDESNGFRVARGIESGGS